MDNKNKTLTSIESVNKANEKGYFGIGIFHHKSDVNIGTLWRSAKCLGASFIFTIGKKYKTQASDTLKTTKDIPIFHYTDFEDFKNHGIPNNCPLVGIELCDKSISILNYNHTERAIYLLGSEGNGLPLHVQNDCASIIELPSLHCLNVATAGSLVMYDRVIKLIN